MRAITANIFLTLDGVMQAPGRPDEDTRGGFRHGGWGAAYSDAVMMKEMTADMGKGGAGAMLFGRRTYMDFFSVWPGRKDNPFSPVLDRAQKYVVSRTLKEPLPWKNSTLLSGDAAVSVGELRRGRGKDIVVLGSGELLQGLMRHDLVDRLVLLIHPLVLGEGRRLFATDRHSFPLRLTKTVPTTKGVIIATYERAASE